MRMENYKENQKYATTVWNVAGIVYKDQQFWQSTIPVLSYDIKFDVELVL